LEDEGEDVTGDEEPIVEFGREAGVGGAEVQNSIALIFVSWVALEGFDRSGKGVSSWMEDCFDRQRGTGGVGSVHFGEGEVDRGGKEGWPECNTDCNWVS